MNTPTFDRIEIPATYVKSLCWRGDTLVDLAGSQRAFHLDGTVEDYRRCLGYRFDATVASPSGRFAVIYERLGTKAVLVDRGKIARELSRSFSEADAFEYPIALFALPNSREVVAHCPDEYGRIEIEDAETGERLTPPPYGEPADFYHSRLAATPDGRWLLSAGWVWHPADTVALFDVERLLTDASYRDGAGETLPDFGPHGSSAAFHGARRLVVTSSPETDLYVVTEANARNLRAGLIGVYDLTERRTVSAARLEEGAGTILPVDNEHVIGFYRHPKLIHVPTGHVLRRWEDLPTGEQDSSIIWGIPPLPPLALDPAHGRFAVADEEKITVVMLPRSPARHGSAVGRAHDAAPLRDTL